MAKKSTTKLLLPRTERRERSQGVQRAAKSNPGQEGNHLGINRIRLVGRIESATTSREGILGRRIEIPIPGARESFDLECNKVEIFSSFRTLKVGQWVEITGAMRRRFWRSGGAIASRSYIEVLTLKAR
ncbi:MAG: hypothetical protein EBX92_09270 [Actinobacteria bacterium]|nr:hypothetical protein [Actinomycetota bacterium]